MAQTTSSKPIWKLLPLFLISAVAGLICLTPPSPARAQTTDYCISCHEMKNYKDELEKSSHAVDKDKQPIHCVQCHLPQQGVVKPLAAKAYLGLKDLFVHYFGNTTNLDRREMQEVARRFVADDNCLACHEDLRKTTKGEPLSEIGLVCHDAYLGKNGTTKNGCAGCHTNLAHLPVFDRRYLVNAKFAERLPLNKEAK